MPRSLIPLAFVALCGQAHASATATRPAAPIGNTGALDTENWFMQAVGPQIAEQTVASPTDKTATPRTPRVSNDRESPM